jgi:uncharacterized protein (TIGR02001 family)
MLKRTAIAGALAAAFTPGLASAQPAPASPHALTGNIGLYSQYIFRGLTQTNRDPALQGGFDYSHTPTGLYLGTWGSNISWLRDFGAYTGGGSLELDFYGGIKGNIGKSDFTYDVGALYYWYPGDVAPGFLKADTFELYGALGWKWITAKYSHSVKNKTFGVGDSRGTYYLDITASVPLGDTGLTAIAHWGKQKFKGSSGLSCDPTGGGAISNNDACASYEDWKIGLSYALPKDFTIGAFYTDTSMTANQEFFYTPASTNRFIGKGTGTIFISKTF